MTTSFDWGAMASFLAVARTGRLTVAARQLGIDHTTLSRRITALEGALQTRLFERSVAGYRLTAQGEAFSAAAQRVEALAHQAEAEIAGLRLRVAGRVRIGATEGFGTSFLAPRLARMRGDNPDLQLELVTMPRLFNLTRREADLAIGLRRPEAGRLVARKLTDYELGLYGSRDYLAAQGVPETTADLTDHRLIGYVQDLVYAEELDYRQTVARDTPLALASSNLMAQLQMTVAGAGLCVLPRFLAEGEPGLVRVLHDPVRLIRTFWLVVHADLRDLASVRHCVDFLIDEVGAQKSLFMG